MSDRQFTMREFFRFIHSAVTAVFYLHSFDSTTPSSFILSLVWWGGGGSTPAPTAFLSDTNAHVVYFQPEEKGGGEIHV